MKAVIGGLPSPLRKCSAIIMNPSRMVVNNALRTIALQPCGSPAAAEPRLVQRRILARWPIDMHFRPGDTEVGRVLESTLKRPSPEGKMTPARLELGGVVCGVAAR